MKYIINKKTVLITIMSIVSLFSFSQNNIEPLNVFKIIIGKDFNFNQYTIGIDLGIIESNRMYTKMDVSTNFNQTLPSYINFGAGYLFKNNFYITPLIGVYITPIVKTNGNYIKNSDILFNAGGEIGFISNRIVSGIFLTNNRIGIKIGIALPNTVDKK